MKKRWIRAIAIILTVMLLPFWSVDASEAYISNVNAEVDERGVVTISGYSSRGPGYAITVKVTAPDGSPVYVNEAASDINGNFAFVGLLSGNREGRYQVTIGADGISNVVRTYFDYYPGKRDVIKANADVNASLDKNGKVTVSGTISTGDGQQLTVLIKDPDDRIELVDSCISRDGGKYKISYYMKNTLKGRYQVTVGSLGLESPVSTYFDYSTDVSVKAGINKYKQVTVTGNIGSGAGHQVNIKITAPSNQIEYVGNTISRNNGDFDLEYTMKNNTTGKYFVTIGAEGMLTTAETYFVYDPSNAELKSLSLENVQLNPGFSPTVTKYSDAVFDNIRNTRVIPEGSNEAQAITVNGVLVKSGESSGRIPLYTGLNTVRIKVTSPDGTNSRTYIVDIERLPAPPSNQSSKSSKSSSQTPSQPVLSSNADLNDLVLHGAMFEDPTQFTSSNTEYLAVMDPESTAITVTPTASDNSARITVNGSPVTSGSSSAPIDVGENGVQVDIVVTAEDGTTKTYILNVIRVDFKSSDAFLWKLAVSYGGTSIELQQEFNPMVTGFDPMVTDYVYDVEKLPVLNTITVIPTASNDAASITVNDAPVASGSPSAPIEVGENGVQVDIVVTAEDGTTRKYVIKIRVIRS